jgi:hypothetical protein
MKQTELHILTYTYTNKLLCNVLCTSPSLKIQFRKIETSRVNNFITFLVEWWDGSVLWNTVESAEA